MIQTVITRDYDTRLVWNGHSGHELAITRVDVFINNIPFICFEENTIRPEKSPDAPKVEGFTYNINVFLKEPGMFFAAMTRMAQMDIPHDPRLWSERDKVIIECVFLKLYERITVSELVGISSDIVKWTDDDVAAARLAI